MKKFYVTLINKHGDTVVVDGVYADCLDNVINVLNDTYGDDYTSIVDIDCVDYS